MGRTGVPLRFAAQQRGPQAQTWGCACASGPAVGLTGRRGCDRAPRLSPLGPQATRRWTRARQTPRACVNCSVASATLRLIVLTETPSRAASSAIRQAMRSGEDALALPTGSWRVGASSPRPARLWGRSAVRRAVAPTLVESEIVQIPAETGPPRAAAGRSMPKCDARHSAAGGGMIKSVWPREKLQETAE